MSINRRAFIVGLGSAATCANGVSVVDLGATGDGLTDDTEAFKRALNIGGDIYVPPGRFLIRETLNIKKPIRLIGPNGTLESDYDAVLDCQGIIIHRRDTNGDALGNTFIEAATNGADGASIERLHLTGGNGHGIWLKARAKIVDCKVSSFSGNGVHIVASTTSQDPLKRGNANSFSLANLRIVNNGGHGVYVNGGDVNAGSALNIDCTSNGGYGVFDSSFLGNTYLACHTANNGLGAYKTDNRSARNLFVNCYSEIDQPPSDLVAPTFVIGGLFGSGFTNTSFHGQFGVDSQGYIDAPRLRVSSKRNSIRSFSITQGREVDEAITFNVDGDNSSGLSWYWDEPSGQWQVRHARLNTRVAQAFTTQLNNIFAGRNNPVSAGNVMFPNGVFLGKKNNARNISCGSAPPIGESGMGDIVYNNAPVSGGSVGWVCVESGEPGVWKKFGKIE